MSRIISALFLVLLTVTPACKRQVDTDPKKVVVAQWGQEKYLIYLPIYVAMEKGFFKAQGLEISLRFSGNDDQVFASVLQGGAQFGVGDPVFPAISKEKGADLGRVVASIVDGVAIWGVTKRPDLPELRSPRDLAGLRIGTFPSPSTNFTLMRRTLLAEGAVLSGSRIVQAPIGGQIALLESGAADIAMVLEPAASKAEAEGYKVVFSSPHFYGPFAFTGLSTATDYVRDHHDVVQGMVNAIEHALSFCHESQGETTEIAKRLFPSLPASVVEKAVARMLSEHTIPESALVSEKSWATAIDARVSVGDLKQPAGYLPIVDPSFARNASVSVVH